MSVYINGIEQVAPHKTLHQDTGADEISVAALSGELADRQPSKAGTSVLGWTDEKLLKGAGAGVAPDEINVPTGYTPPTRSLFAQMVKLPTALSARESFLTSDDLAVFGYCCCSFAVPSDFTTLVGVYLIGLPDATGTIDWTVTTNFAASAQAYNAHSDSDTGDGLAVTLDTLKVIDISAAFTGLAAADYVGVKFKIDALATVTGYKVIGVVFKYSE